MSILVTGGAGYIGSHTCVELLKAGRDIVVLDNFSNSKPEALRRIEKITGKSFKSYEVDLLDREGVERVFAQNQIDAVIHFAGLKAVGESCKIPLKYYHNNLTGTLVLCQVMEKFGCKKFVFSSSATVYGMHNPVPFKEDMPLSTTNPYGTTKLFIEKILTDLHEADPTWSVALLRYFNPIGAHESGLLGEDPNGIPNNLLPYISQVATGKLDDLAVYGNDYDTPDGTGVRDYIHVVDLAVGHLKALDYIADKNVVEAINLGTGHGYSVLDVVHAFEKACGFPIKHHIAPRRPGDIATSYADCTRAKELLGWTAQRTIDDMCADSWRFSKQNPNGL
ncbi:MULTISPECIES: UDP-glucose 4-epimerase GalE [Anaerotruncus]|jgi:UDP-glucose 4-epimerase|uniref:UDP-glucose 4-epimerase GalE n=1 Tax=Anaerotruncus TaxID=244127 RepID=UPI000830F40E|nr:MULTISPECIES: UDP-glucose 4-epimerase GalE [Anaerotruncus]RGX54489.1 UDP-glucose 4-epimerase GalE [Anaerotruncus sp. AF02-27]